MSIIGEAETVIGPYAALAKVIILVLAFLSLIAIPAAIVQTVRLDGISLFGWHIVDGALQAATDSQNAAAAAQKSLGTCQANRTTLQASIDQQNTQIQALGQASATAQARAAQALAAAQAKANVANAREAQIMAAKPGADLCRSADALILENVQ